MTWQAKLERAKRHYTELDAVLAGFSATKPYKVSTRRNDEGRLVYYLSGVADIPIDISLITGDVIQNLRSALDQLAYELWVRESNGQGRSTKIYFPIDNDEASYRKGKAGKTQGISAQSLAIIDSLKPYKDGNDVLWRIHTLNNHDKHRLLVTVGSSYRSFDVGAYAMHGMRKMFTGTGDFLSNLPQLSLFLKPADNMFPLKAGGELLVLTADDEENPDMEFRFDVLLHEPGIVEGETIPEVLTAMIKEVERIGPLFNL